MGETIQEVRSKQVIPNVTPGLGYHIGCHAYARVSMITPSDEACPRKRGHGTRRVCSVPVRALKGFPNTMNCVWGPKETPYGVTTNRPSALTLPPVFQSCYWPKAENLRGLGTESPAQPHTTERERRIGDSNVD